MEDNETKPRRYLECIRTALQEGNSAQAKKAANSLRSYSLLTGATKLGEVCLRLEREKNAAIVKRGHYFFLDIANELERVEVRIEERLVKAQAG